MTSSARIDDVQRKYEENPRRYFAVLASELRRAGDPRRAVAICESGLRLDPAHLSGHVVLAQALADLGDRAGAESAFARALELDPENLVALRALGDLARERGDREAARGWYQHALEADPRDPELVTRLSTLESSPLSASEAVGQGAPPSATVEVPAPAPAVAPAEAVPPEPEVGTFAADNGMAPTEPLIDAPTVDAPAAEDSREREFREQLEAQEFTAGFFAAILEERPEDGTAETPAPVPQAADVPESILSLPAADVLAGHTGSPEVAASIELEWEGGEGGEAHGVAEPGLPPVADASLPPEPEAGAEVAAAPPAALHGAETEPPREVIVAEEAPAILLDEPGFLDDLIGADFMPARPESAEAAADDAGPGAEPQEAQPAVAELAEPEIVASELAEPEHALAEPEIVESGAVEPETMVPELEPVGPSEGELRRERPEAVAEEAEPLVDVERVSPPWHAARPEDEAAHGASAVEERIAAGDGGSQELPEAAAEVEAAPLSFATATMATLLLQQGFRDDALQIFRQLSAQQPDDAELRARVEELEADLSRPAPAGEAGGLTVAGWLGQLAGARPAPPPTPPAGPGHADDPLAWHGAISGDDLLASAAAAAASAVTWEGDEGTPPADDALFFGDDPLDWGQVAPEAPPVEPAARRSEDADVAAAWSPAAAEPGTSHVGSESEGRASGERGVMSDFGSDIISIDELLALPASGDDERAAGALAAATLAMQGDAEVDAQLAEASAEDPGALERLLGEPPASVASMRHGVSFSFEQFFETSPRAAETSSETPEEAPPRAVQAGADVPAPPAPSLADDEEAAAREADLADFHAWLAGLSKS